jgi:predicted RNA-binding Zn-ribbon protein involved in translation (DUF1610 family)
MLEAIALSTKQVLNATDFLSSLEVKRTGGKFYCPGCQKEVIPRSRYRWANHFYHKRGNSGCAALEPRRETAEHKAGKQTIVHWLKTVFEPLEVEIDTEKAVNSRRPDVLVSFQGNILLAGECQVSPISIENLESRTKDLSRSGINVLWFVGAKVKARVGHYFERIQGNWINVGSLYCYLPKIMQSTCSNGNGVVSSLSLFGASPLRQAIEKLGEENFRQIVAEQFCRNVESIKPEDLTHEKLDYLRSLIESMMVLVAPVQPVLVQELLVEPPVAAAVEEEILGKVPYTYDTKKFDRYILDFLQRVQADRKKIKEVLGASYPLTANDRRLYWSERDQELNQGSPKPLWQRAIDIRIDSLLNAGWIKPIQGHENRSKWRKYELTTAGEAELQRLQS